MAKCVYRSVRSLTFAGLIPLNILIVDSVSAADKTLRVLGEQYLTGTGVAADPVKARSYLEQAVAAGDVTAQRKLGVALIKGEGLAKDTAKGLALLEAAAAKDVGAKTALANLLLAGTDLPKDAKRGIGLLTDPPSP